VTRKDYEAIASCIRGEREGWSQPEPRIAVSRIARHLAEIMAADNPRFDRKRFLAACGVA
jgi:hypothetical protein